jgi:hypothetical protein
VGEFIQPQRYVAADRVVPAIGAALRLTLVADRPADGGQGRTFFAWLCGPPADHRHRLDGHPADHRHRLRGKPVVVKWGLDPDLPEKIPYIAAQIPELVRRGCRVPAVIAHGALGPQAYAWVQERLPGEPATTLDDVLIAELVQLIRRMAGAPAGPHRNDMAYWVPAVVFDDMAGWWQAAAAMDPAAARFCRRLRAWVGPELPEPAHDYVHSDLNLSNILVADGRIAGLIDAENLGVGDRAIDIARLAFEWLRLRRVASAGLASAGLAPAGLAPAGLAPAGLAPAGLGKLIAFGREVTSPAGWRTAVGYELIGELGWRSEHIVQPRPMQLLPVCEDLLDALD